MRSTRSAPRRWKTHQPAATTSTMTAAVRTARELFIWPASLSSFLHSRPRFPLGLTPPDGLAFVVRLLAFREADGDLHAAILQIHPDGHDRHAALRRLADQLADFLAVQQQLAAARGIVIAVAAIAVGTDVDVVDPHLPR